MAEFAAANEQTHLSWIHYVTVHLEADVQLQPHTCGVIETVMGCLMTVPGVLLIGLHHLLTSAPWSQIITIRAGFNTILRMSPPKGQMGNPEWTIQVMCLLSILVFLTALCLPHRQVLEGGKKKELKISFKTKAFIAKNALDMKNNQISHGSSVQDDV